jgi:hypothetical protein
MPFGGHLSAFRLEGGQGARHSLTLTSEARSGFALAFHDRDAGGGLAPLGGCGNGGVDLCHLPSEVGNPAGRHLDPGSEGGVPRLDPRGNGAALGVILQPIGQGD